jgi:hypothetical protein
MTAIAKARCERKAHDTKTIRVANLAELIGLVGASVALRVR